MGMSGSSGVIRFVGVRGKYFPKQFSGKEWYLLFFCDFILDSFILDSSLSSSSLKIYLSKYLSPQKLPKGIPFYVGLMGLATEGHKGFVSGIREGVLLHSIATGAYMSVPHLVKRREKVSVIDEQARAKGENIYGE